MNLLLIFLSTPKDIPLKFLQLFLHRHRQREQRHEIEWYGGSETMDEILARIHRREDAVVKRERAMAYAFSHQWRANSYSNLGLYTPELSKANWGWSWVEHWIAARPWESRVPVQSSPNKGLSWQVSKAGKNVNAHPMKEPNFVKSISPSGKASIKARKFSYPADDEPAAQAEETTLRKNMRRHSTSRILGILQVSVSNVKGSHDKAIL